MSRAAALLLIASGLFPLAARGAEPPIAVAIRDCPTAPVSPEAFLRSLRVELAGEGRACCMRVASPTEAAPAASPTRLAVDTCGPTPDLVQVSVRNQLTGAALDRQVALGDVSPDARPRALALAVAELLRTAAAPPPAPPVVAAAAPPVAPPARPPDGWIPMLGLAARTHPTGGVTSWGFHAGLELARGPWQVAASGHVESADPSVALGKVDIVFLGGSLEVGWRVHLGQTALDLGVTGGLGFVHMDGVTAAPGALAGTGSGLEATAGARASYDFWRLPHDLAQLRLVLEGGGVIHGVDATVNGQHAAGLTGPYLLGGLMATLGPY